MTTVRIVGIGCHPRQLTEEALRAVAGCDYVIAADKGDDDPLLALRRTGARVVVVSGNHDHPQRLAAVAPVLGALDVVVHVRPRSRRTTRRCWRDRRAG